MFRPERQSGRKPPRHGDSRGGKLGASMRHARIRAPLLVAIACAALTPAANPCTLAEGNFQQITRLRGTVVGVNSGDWRHPFRWIRQHVVRGDVRLTVCRYRPRVTSRYELSVVKVVRTDKGGSFDTCTLGVGQYTLVIDDPWGDNSWFYVEISSLSKATDSVLIDISPVYPNCTGGHEFRAVAKWLQPW